MTIPAALLALGACANIGQTPANTPLSQIVQQYGAPDLECTARSGATRVVWSTQPMGQYAWGGELDAQGNVIQISQLLNDQHFKLLNTGSWTQDDVSCEFGPPAFIDSVGLPGARTPVFNYRYKQDGFWNSLMYVFFDTQGRYVTHHHPGPDPMFEPDRYWPMF